MEAATERRAPHEPRVPLDALVEIAPEGASESFEADAVNVGPGGLSMRSPILPDVGSRLRCRFNSPHDGSSVDARCEVVWAHDSGPNLGEFGLRFRQLSPEDAEAIRRLVDSWHAVLDVGGRSPQPATVTLRLDGVGQPVEAKLVHRAADALVVEQPLPFLRVGTGVVEGEHAGRLESVDLRMEGDVPRLVLTVGYDAPAEPALDGADADSTLPDAPAPVLADTMDGPGVDEASGVTEAPAPAEVNDPSVVDPGEGASLDAPAGADEEVPELGLGGSERSEASLASSQLDAEALAASSRLDAQALAAFRSSARRELRRALDIVRDKAARSRVWLLALWSKARPSLRAWWARARHLGGDLGRRARRRGRALVGVLSKRSVGRKRSPGRRTTRAPQRRATRGARAKNESPRPRPRVRLRWVLLVVAAAGGVVAALGTGGAPTPELTPKPPKLDPERGDTGGAELVEPTPTAAASAAAPEASEDAVPVEPEMPRALPDAPRGAGPMPAPSFPSVGETRPSPPGAVPSDSPYAAEAEGGGATSFGLDEVPGGQQFRIRLSRPARDLRGELTDDGFRVVVAGANATEGARRIASVHPDVERARIENDGERAVLSVRFVGSRRPPYRVHTSGAALFVTVGR